MGNGAKARNSELNGKDAKQAKPITASSPAVAVSTAVEA